MTRAYYPQTQPVQFVIHVALANYDGATPRPVFGQNLDRDAGTWLLTVGDNGRLDEVEPSDCYLCDNTNCRVPGCPLAIVEHVCAGCKCVLRHARQDIPALSRCYTCRDNNAAAQCMEEAARG